MLVSWLTASKSSCVCPEACPERIRLRDCGMADIVCTREVPPWRNWQTRWTQKTLFRIFAPVSLCMLKASMLAHANVYMVQQVVISYAGLSVSCPEFVNRVATTGCNQAQ
jgi:hypothetical protein